jgi:hypothetical protein
LRPIGLFLSVAQSYSSNCTERRSADSRRIIPGGKERSIFERATTAQLRLNRANSNRAHQ